MKPSIYALFTLLLVAATTPSWGMCDDPTKKCLCDQMPLCTAVQKDYPNAIFTKTAKLCIPNASNTPSKFISSVSDTAYRGKFCYGN